MADSSPSAMKVRAKARALSDLMQPELPIGGGIGVLAGQIIALQPFFPLLWGLRGFLTLFFSSGAAMISNDYFDCEVDAVNHPERPRPFWTRFSAGVDCFTTSICRLNTSTRSIWETCLSRQGQKDHSAVCGCVIDIISNLQWLCVKKADEAIALYDQGFNCAQPLLSVFAPDYGLDRDTALRIAQGFGAGIARTDNLCGQVSSPVMILGLRYGGTQADDTTAREKTFQVVGEFIKQFKERNGAITCTGLLGYNLSDPRQAAEAKERKATAARCPKLIQDAAQILETLL